MRVSNTNPETIKRFQENLKLICWVVGWSDHDLADELDVHRVTVSKLKSGSIEIRKIQYLAIRNLVHAFLEINSTYTYKSRVVLSWVLKHIYNDYEQKEFEYFRNSMAEVVKNTGSKVGMEKIHENVLEAAYKILEEHQCCYGGEWQ